MLSAAQKQDEKAAHRLYASPTAEQYRELHEMAQRNRVSVEWVIREAIERPLKDDTSLLHLGKE